MHKKSAKKCSFKSI